MSDRVYRKRAVVKPYGWGDKKRDRWAWVHPNVVANDVIKLKFPEELEQKYRVIYCDTILIPRDGIVEAVETALPWEDNRDVKR